LCLQATPRSENLIYKYEKDPLVARRWMKDYTSYFVLIFEMK